MQPTLFATERYERFRRFHRANPEVWRLFVRFAEEARQRRQRFGARMIGERIRWYVAIETDEESPKLNDHYWPYYSRLLMLMRPEFEGFFERRDTRFDVDDRTLLRECGYEEICSEAGKERPDAP